MENNLQFRICRACLVSSDVAELIDLFEEPEENLENFQNVSRIDILQDKNKYYALICKECMVKVEDAFEIGERIRWNEQNLISKIRAKIQAENREKKLQSGEGELKFSDKQRAGIVIKESESEENMSIGNPTIKQKLPDEDLKGPVVKIEVEEEKSQEVVEVNYQNSLEDQDCRAQNFNEAKMETEEDFGAPVSFYSEFTLEEFNGLNSKKLEVVVKKLKTIEKEDCEVVGGTQSVHKAQVKHQEVAGTNRKRNRGQMATIVKQLFKCNICSKGFPHNSWLKQHMLTHAFSNDSTANPNRPFKYNFDGCQTYFKLKNHLEKHEKTHNPIKVKCSICSKGFTCDDTLQKHINAVHLKKKTFKCDRCPKIFNFRANFLKHFRHIHIEKKNSSRTFPEPAVMTSNHCKICFRLCSSRSNLKKHIEMVHEKKRNFACDLCSKTFYFKSGLRTHKATHNFTNDDTTNASRPHRCDFVGCGKYFKTEQELHKHKKRMHTK